MALNGQKLFVGARIRNLRQSEKLTQRAFAERLEISASYLNQIENNQRPISASVILALVDRFGVDIAQFASDDSDRVVAHLSEALADPVFGEHRPSRQELKIATSNTPDLAHAFLALHRAYLSGQERLASLDDALQGQSDSLAPQPYEEVRDFFHYIDNYVDWLDRGAEALAGEMGLPSGSTPELCADRLRTRHGIEVVSDGARIAPDVMREFRANERVLYLNPDLSRGSQAFQLLQQIALIEEEPAIHRILSDAKFRTEEARAIAKLGLVNYFAGAALMPYQAFLTKARELRHDLELLARHFRASLEQVAHRLSTLQRPGLKGIPFYFMRVDRAGTITKRHSATRLQFARFGGACPLWCVHKAFENPGEFVRQRAETPDGERYFSIATTITKRALGYGKPIRRYAIGLGCQCDFAPEIVYADGLDFGNAAAFDRIGVSCRICDRSDCQQRAMPPIGRKIAVNETLREVVPYSIMRD
ncbi:MAG: short-chain fatty acyl-CoA regulator family protein [Pseudomonadota bacterium]